MGHSLAQGYSALAQVLGTHLDHLPDYSIKEFLDIRDALGASLLSLRPDFAPRYWGNLYETYQIALWNVMHKAHCIAQYMVSIAIDPNPTHEKCYSIVKECPLIQNAIDRWEEHCDSRIDAPPGFKREMVAKMVLDPKAGGRIPLQNVRPSTFLIEGIE